MKDNLKSCSNKKNNKNHEFSVDESKFKGIIARSGAR